MKLQGIREVGSGKAGSLHINFNKVVELVFEPNVTDMDDPDKVLASWGFKDSKGRKGFIWSYKYEGDLNECDEFSVAGDAELLKELFGYNLKLW